MKIKKIFLWAIRIIIIIGIPIILFKSFQYFSKASPIKANIVVDTRKVIGIIPANWKALAQGGEEPDKRMLENVVPPIAGLFPRYIRIDHIYDFYDVIKRGSDKQLRLDWQKLDQTVCDIYHTGAKPFFSLGYMPEVLSGDSSLISKPKNWNDWSFVVQKTIEHYSGKNTRLCGQVTGPLLEDIYYEVWNEPDLETFGKWSLYPGQKSYQDLYYHSVVGAQKAQNVNHFLIGGPTTTAAYKNWIQVFADFIIEKNLRIDFLSWHHYSTKPDDFFQDVQNINRWLSGPKYIRFQHLPKIISEWAYDSAPNQIADTNIGAAHTVASIRNLIEQNVQMAFAFEIKDGPNPSWGLLTYQGEKKPRYYALNLLNSLGRARLSVTGEGTFVRAIASNEKNKTTLVLVNYDQDNRNTEMVPVSFVNLIPGNYTIIETNLEGKTVTTNQLIDNYILNKSIIMSANSVVVIELIKQ